MARGTSANQTAGAAALDLELKRAELEIKRAEAQASKWRNPLVVAILAASVAGLGNAAVSMLNASSAQSLEESRAESGRILEAIKTGDTEKAAANLEFLLDAGLLTDSRADRIRDYLRRRAPGTGAALPTASGRFRLEGADALPQQARDEIPHSLTRYSAYLARIGFSAPPREITIRLDADVGNNAFYQPEEGVIRIGPRIAGDPFVPLWTYTEYVLRNDGGGMNAGNESYDVVDNALSDYFSASFLNDPVVGRAVAAVIGNPGQPYLRRLDNHLSFNEATNGSRHEAHEIGEIWGGLFWDFRTRLGQDKADRLLVRTWQRLGRDRQGGSVIIPFLTCLILEARDSLPGDVPQVLEAMRSRDFLPAPNRAG